MSKLHSTIVCSCACTGDRMPHVYAAHMWYITQLSPEDQADPDVRRIAQECVDKLKDEKHPDTPQSESLAFILGDRVPMRRRISWMYRVTLFIAPSLRKNARLAHHAYATSDFVKHAPVARGSGADMTPEVNAHVMAGARKSYAGGNVVVALQMWSAMLLGIMMNHDHGAVLRKLLTERCAQRLHPSQACPITVCCAVLLQ